MSNIIEYETPINNFKRITQKDDSDEFCFILKIRSCPSKESKISTTMNKARIISNKINCMYQIDPTINQYEIEIPSLLLRNNTEEYSEEEIHNNSILIAKLLKSTTEQVTFSKEEETRVKILFHLLGEIKYDDSDIKFENIDECMSYLSTDFHYESIKFLSKHLFDIIKEGQLFHLNESLIIEIIDEYFNSKSNDEPSQQEKEEKEEKREEEEIFEQLCSSGECGIVIHFLLRIGVCKSTKDMIEYILEHLSDEIISREMNQIVREFIFHLSEMKEKIEKKKKKQEKKEKESIETIEYEGDELKGIISHLKEKHGSDLFDKGEINIRDIGTHHQVDGSLSNLIKYDNDHINEHYYNNGGGNPLPNSNEGWIEFDFKNRKVKLTSYTLRTSGNGPNGLYHAKSWRIVGSNDGKSWELINQQVNNSSLNGSHRQHRFECNNNNQYYRFIRYIQDDSWQSQREHNIWLTCVEFFGSISEQ